ncbi:universal stress protein [Nocardioides sp. QY071]|uniref:universal stress protein n=1 Tax=Nocardioides sp. QY071 TaxID=3044187 RepID=UPI00249C38B6|nr:universal stress protein [Nocardioides sp. QY071]WGY04526.1 universal stress protein [Nocardioides sp. QY071]
MNDVVALVDDPGPEHPARVVAEAGARLLACRARSVSVHEASSVEQVLSLARTTLSEPGVEALVVAGTDSAAPAWRIITDATKPVFVVPTGARLPRGRFSRVLLPLDGGSTAADAVAVLASRMASSATLLAAHVFEPDTVPAYWDQAAHAGPSWEQEFLARSVPEVVGLRLCHGDPATEVVAQVEACGADLLVLGWGRRLAGSRARIVRRALAGPVPVLLIGTGYEAASARGSRTPTR